MQDYKKNSHNVGTDKQNAMWVLDESKLSEMDLSVLKQVNFPKELQYQQVAQKRIANQNHGDIFMPKVNFDINDLKYLINPKWIGLRMITKEQPTGSTPAEIKFSKDYKDKSKRSKANTQFFIDGNYMEQELEWLLNKFSAPKATKSMKAIDSEENKPAPKKKSKAKAKPKGISNQNKGKIKTMYLEEKKSLAEIVEALGTPKDKTVAYIKTLD